MNQIEQHESCRSGIPASGRVLPAASLAIAAAVQRTAGIQRQVTMGSAQVGNEQGRRGCLTATVATAGSTPGEARAAVDDVVPQINDRQIVASPALPFRALARSHQTRPTRAPSRLGARELTVSAPNPSIVRKPAWILDFSLEIYRQLMKRPGGKPRPVTQRDTLTVKFTVRLKGIPAIDLDRS